MSQVVTVPRAPRQDIPGKGFSITLFSLAAGLLLLLLGWVLADGPAFNDFPGRIIGISLLSDIDPHYRTYLFLLLSALVILASCAFFTLRGTRPGCARPLPFNSTAALLLACTLANAAAALLHTDSSLFSNGAAHCALLLALWTWHRWTSTKPDPLIFLLRLGLGWQGATLILWLAGSAPGLALYGLFLALFLLAGPCVSWLAGNRDHSRRAALAASAWLLCAPLLLVIAIEWAYMSQGSAVQPRDSLTIWCLLSLPAIALAWTLAPGVRLLAGLAALCVLMSTFAINQYDNEILYRGYDIFHLAEPMLPLQQWDSYRSLPFLDYHPGHGLFDVFPQVLYHLANRGDPMEAMLWGNGYFHGWLMQTIYIGLLYFCLSRFAGPVVAFFLLWLLPVFHLLDPYDALLLLPVLNISRLPGNRRPLAWWSLQWLLTLALALWRADFGLIVAAGNFVLMAAIAWHRRETKPLLAGVTSLLAPALLLVLAVQLLPGNRSLAPLLEIFGNILDIQVLAASFDRFYRTWNHMAWMQYIVMPLLGALAGGYSLARLYLREDRSHLAIHLAVIFVTAIGFALSIRLFQRHSLVEGFSNTNFFYLAPLLAFFTLRMRRGWRGPIAAVLVTAAFLATPKTLKYSEKSLWSPRNSYPATTHDTTFPELAKSGERLVNKVKKYDGFEDFSAQYLGKGQTFYDFANAPLLYMLAGVKLPVFVYETVWHTSEKVQDSTLAELEALRLTRRLPFVVFRQNRPLWDALDGVDNALRSYKMAEYIYANYRPCLRIDKLDIWTDKRADCRGNFKNRLAIGSPGRRGARFLKQNYLEQDIAFGHLPYIWANYDSLQDPVAQTFALTAKTLDPTSIELANAGAQRCRNSGCYLDLEIESSVAQELPLYFENAKQLSFRVRPGSHRYRIRISALWRWHQGVDSDRLILKPEHSLSVNAAQLVQLRPHALSAGNT